jgi:citrate lyase beta subunit
MRLLMFSNDAARSLAVQNVLSDIPVSLTVIVDIERDGKAERQDKKSFISNHQLSDVESLKLAGVKSVIARINKFSNKTPDEIETAINFGAQGIMLPFFKYPYEVEEAFNIVSGRAEFIPLFETVESIFCADKIFDLVDFSYFHIGLNDLSLQTRANNMFEIINTSAFKGFCALATSRERKFGIGGVGNPSDSTMDVPACAVIKSGAELGATGWILSRQFFKLNPGAYQISLEELYRKYLLSRLQFLSHVQ